VRLGVLDVGSNTIHLQVVDGHLGAPPIPNSSHKSIIRLTEYLDDSGAITPLGIEKITEAILTNLKDAEPLEIDELLASAEIAHCFVAKSKSQIVHAVRKIRRTLAPLFLLLADHAQSCARENL